MKNKKTSGIIIAIILIAVAAAGYYLSSTTKVPDVSGLTVREAKAELKDASLIVEEKEPVYSEEYRCGRVISVENSGKRLKKNSTVAIVESLGAEISMYNLVGISQEEAEQKLGEAGIAMKFKMDYSEEYEEGLIIKQSIDENIVVHEFDKIIVTVSKGPKPFEIKDYKGTDIDVVEKEAKELGLELKIEKKFSSKYDKGEVISQTPKAGTEVKRGDTISLVVSKGAEQVKVPDITGKTKSDAEKALKKAGFKVGRISYDYSSSVSEGRVVSQEIDGGDKTDKGSTIDFVVSLGKKPVYRPSGGSSGGSGGATDLGGFSDDNPTDLGGF